VVARCRDFTRGALLDWGWIPAADQERLAVAEDVLLLVSELVTNACLHAGGPRELRLRWAGERLRIEVADAASALPEARSPHVGSRPGGHGLHIVARLGRGWGVDQQADGKTVWVEVALPGASA
jgi:anti-sigma regulatory factor (Ser/Thr protein kinase)